MSEVQENLEEVKEFFHRIEEIEQCWRDYFIERKVPDTRLLKPMVWEAWQKCTELLLNPWQIQREMISEQEYNERRSRMLALIEATRPIFDTYMEQAGAGVHTLDLYDADLIFIHTFGGASATSESRYASPGFSCREESAGSTAMSLCRKHRRAVQLVGPEHFDAKLHDRICTSVPIFDRAGKLMAVFNVVERLNRDALRTLGVLSAIAQGITYNLENMRQRVALERTNVFNQEILESITNGIIVVDGDGVIRFVNSSALKYLGISDRCILADRRAESCFGRDNIFDKVLQSGRDRNDTDMTIRIARKTFHFVGSVRGLKYTGSERGGVLGVFNDLHSTQHILKNVAGWQATMTFQDILGSSASLQNVILLAEKASALPYNILIQGESGTGKEVFAQAIHNSSRYAEGPFVSINCAAIPGSLIESELFGYESGSFTGARKEGQPGKFELAQNGTLFLDEINSMPLDMQTKLLRVLQEKAVTRIGGNCQISLNTRIIAASNENLFYAVKSGRFRMDLYYRMNVVMLELPPLRERPEDIAELCDHFLQGKNITISKGAIILLEHYAWPGNVRELENIIERADIQAKMESKSVIDAEVLRKCGNFHELLHDIPRSGYVEAVRAGYAVSDKRKMEEDRAEFSSVIEREKRQELLTALEKAHWNISRAARQLGIARNTIYNRMKRYGMICREDNSIR